MELMIMKDTRWDTAMVYEVKNVISLHGEL